MFAPSAEAVCARHIIIDPRMIMTVTMHKRQVDNLRCTERSDCALPAEDSSAPTPAARSVARGEILQTSLTGYVPSELVAVQARAYQRGVSYGKYANALVAAKPASSPYVPPGVDQWRRQEFWRPRP